MAKKLAVNTWKLCGSRAEVVAAALMMRGFNPRTPAASPLKLHAECQLTEDGEIPPEFMTMMEHALKSGRYFLRTEGELASLQNVTEAVDALERKMAAGMRGPLLMTSLIPYIKPGPVQPILRAKRKLYLYRMSGMAELAVFTGVQPEPPVLALLKKLIVAAEHPLLPTAGILNLASHVFSDEEVGFPLPRDPDLRLSDFDEIPHSELIGKLALLFFMVAPQGRYALGRKCWGVSSPLGIEASQSIQTHVVPVRNAAANPFGAMVNLFSSETYALTLSFTTHDGTAHKAFNALVDAFPTMEATACYDLAAGGYTTWYSPEGLSLVALEQSVLHGVRPRGPYDSDAFDREEETM